MSVLELTIGCHLSSAKGYLSMAETAAEIGANTFQFFTRNPRGGRAKAIDHADIEAYGSFAGAHGIEVILAHAPYTLNPCSDNDRTREFAIETLADDLARMESTPHQMYNMHPGSAVGQTKTIARRACAEALNEVLDRSQTTTVLLETMSGKGSEIGSTFEELADIIDRVKLDDHVGVCLDTCHIWDGGYDIAHELDVVIDHFDKVIGLSRLCAIHLNDSKNPCGSRKDRHEKLGEGCIGFEALSAVTNHPMLSDLPFYLETPNELPGYADEISRLKASFKG